MKRLIDICQRYRGFFLLCVLGLVPFIWFWGRGSVLIDGVDTNFPLNPLLWFSRRFFVWSNVLNAGSDFSASSAGLFFHFIQVLPYIVGFNLQTVELVSLLFWFMLIVTSSYFLAWAIFPKRFLSRTIFTIFYSFNIYLFNTWENVKVTNLSLMAGIPLALGALILLDENKIHRYRGILLAAIAGIILSGTGINPAYFVSFFLVIFIYSLGRIITSERDKLKHFTNFILFSTVIVLVNVFWIFPTLNYIIKGVPLSGSIDTIGFTNWIDSLSENNSLFNVIRLQGAWDWYSTDSLTGLPLYIPYALNYFFRFPFVVFSLVPPLLSMFALVFRKKSSAHYYLSFSLMFVIGVFLGTGTHEPTGVLFRFLINHLPFFSLFRSPWYIFTPLIVIAYAGLIGLLFNYLIDYLEIKAKPLKGIFIYILGTVLLIGNLVYCYPLITGKIFRPGRADTFYINFPSYVFDAAKWLNSMSSSGRIISYPDDEIENYVWGYRGIESILELITDKEVVFSSLNASNSPVSQLVKEFYLAAKKGETSMALNIAHKLNANYLLQKKDQQSLSPQQLDLMNKAVEVKNFGQWVFYKLPASDKSDKIFSSNNLFFVYPYSKGSIAVSLLDKNRQIINPDDSEVKSISGIEKLTRSVIVAENSQAVAFSKFISSSSGLVGRLSNQDFSRVEYNFEIFKSENYAPVLEKYHLQDFGLVSNGDLKAQIDGKDITLFFEKSNDSYIYFHSMPLSAGKHVLVLSLKDNNLVIGGNFENGELFQRGGYGEGSVNYEIKEDISGKYLAITNYDKAEASANFKVNFFDPYFPYYVSVRYRQVYGNNGLVVPEQNTTNTLIKAQNERLPNYPEWGKIGFYYDPVKTESEMKVFLVSPFTTDPLGTKIYYDDLSVNKVFINNLVFLEENVDNPNLPVVNYSKMSPVEYQGTVKEGISSHALVFTENFSPDWQIKFSNIDGGEIAFSPKHFSVNLYANAWYMEGMPDEYRFTIFYRPQLLRYAGVAISSTILLVLAGYEFYRKIRRRQ